ncbi:MAG TPA: FHA domain-containing protein [Ilumatobacteraceae bacterium]|nr:FHA domain-containing protein [Ilumatobacteraceae bacterium]
MNTQNSAEGTVDDTAAGVVDELVARVTGLTDARSGPGPPGAAVAVLIDGQRVEPGPASILVGRSVSMFGIDHPKVSRRHVGVQLVDGVLIGSDLGSRNGTWLVRDGERTPLTPMAVLWPGDRLVTLDDVELVRVAES